MPRTKSIKEQSNLPTIKNPELLTIAETCTILRISRKIFDKANRDNKIKIARFGIKKMFVHIDEVNRLKREGCY